MEIAHILIVEDDFSVLTSIKKIIEKQGHKIAGTLSNGEEAVQFCRNHVPELVIMDTTLRGEMDGIEAAEIIHSDFEIPIVFLTTNTKEKLLENTNSSEPFAYIFKPFEEAEIKAAINMALLKHKFQKSLRTSKHFLRLIVDSDPNLIFVKDAGGRYKLVNIAMADFIGLKPAEIVGKNDQELLEILTGEEKNRFSAIRENPKGILSHKKSFIPEVTFEGSSGEKKWYQTNYVPIDTDFIGNGVLAVSTEITGRKLVELELKQSYEKLKRLLKATVNGLVSAVERRDPYTAGHQRKVGQLACAIANELGLSQDVIDGLYLAALVHDVGKIFIPIEILTKPVHLSELEFSLIKNHPTAAYDILKTIEFSWPVADIVLQHHERLDGSGYPQGLTSDQILFEAKILAVADVIEAMASHRPYRPALGISKALQEIEDNAGNLYDEKVSTCCLELFKVKKFQFYSED